MKYISWDNSIKDIFVMLLMPLLQSRRAISSLLFMRVMRIRATIRRYLPRLSAKFPNEGPDNSYRRPAYRIIPHDSLLFPVTIRYSRGICQIRFMGVHFRRKPEIAINALTIRLTTLNDINCYLIDHTLQVSC